MWWLLACDPGLAGLDFPMTMAGDGVVARLTRERGCQGSTVRVGLWGPGFRTNGDSIAAVVDEEDGSTWLHFSVQTGLGEAVAAMRVEGDAAVIPMGMRPGEFEIHLSKNEMSDGALQVQLDSSAQLLEKEVSFWQQGRFLLKLEDEVVGEVRFRGDKNPVVSVHDAWWLTPRPVEAVMETSGAEIVLRFEAEPSLQGEGSLMRINVPLRSAVVPMGPVPVPEERRFDLVPGELSDQERELAVQQAVDSAFQLEKQYIQTIIPKLSAAAHAGDGECRKFSDLDNEWTMMLQGYDVVLTAESNGCSVGIEPSQKQHGRTFRGVIKP